MFTLKYVVHKYNYHAYMISLARKKQLLVNRLSLSRKKQFNTYR